MTELSMKGWQVLRPASAFLAFSGENHTEEFYIVLPDSFEDYTYSIDVKNSKTGKKTVIPLEKSELGGEDALYTLLACNQIGAAGFARMQVIGRNSTGAQVKKSNVFSLRIGESISSSDDYADMPASAFEQYAAKAGESADSAKGSAKEAGEYKNAAENAAEDAETSATLSKSYAVGGTGARDGEDTDNSRYYAGEAGKSAGAAKNSSTSAAESARLSETAAALSMETHGLILFDIKDDGHLYSKASGAMKDVTFALNAGRLQYTL